MSVILSFFGLESNGLHGKMSEIWKELECLVGGFVCMYFSRM